MVMLCLIRYSTHRSGKWSRCAAHVWNIYQMGLFSKHFHWHSIPKLPLTIVGILLGSGALLRVTGRPILSIVAILAAAALAIVKILNIVLTAKSESMSSRLLFGVTCITPVVVTASAIIVGMPAGKSDTTPIPTVIQQRSGDSSPNIAGVEGDVTVKYGHAKEIKRTN